MQCNMYSIGQRLDIVNMIWIMKNQCYWKIWQPIKHMLYDFFIWKFVGVKSIYCSISLWKSHSKIYDFKHNKKNWDY